MRLSRGAPRVPRTCGIRRQPSRWGSRRFNGRQQGAIRAPSNTERPVRSYTLHRRHQQNPIGDAENCSLDSEPRSEKRSSSLRAMRSRHIIFVSRRRCGPAHARVEQRHHGSSRQRSRATPGRRDQMPGVRHFWKILTRACWRPVPRHCQHLPGDAELEARGRVDAKCRPWLSARFA